jgi:hypothetical protein
MLDKHMERASSAVHVHVLCSHPSGMSDSRLHLLYYKYGIPLILWSKCVLHQLGADEMTKVSLDSTYAGFIPLRNRLDLHDPNAQSQCHIDTNGAKCNETNDIPHQDETA